MDFVNELKKYIKITRVCDNNNITKCFNKEVIWNEGEDPVDMSTIKNAASLGQDDWDTDTVAVQFATIQTRHKTRLITSLRQHQNQWQYFTMYLAIRIQIPMAKT